MNKKHHIIWAIIIFLILLPSTARANSITPMTFLFCSRLFLGNFIIGLFEGLLIAWILKVPKKRAIWIMILANYASMFGGLLVIDLLGMSISSSFFGKYPLYNAYKIFIFMPILAFVMTVLMEWPFCHWIQKKVSKSKNRSFRASLFAQIVSYAVILPFYVLTSNINLYRNTKIEPTLSFSDNPKAWIYYVSFDDDYVYRCRTDGSDRQKVYDQDTIGYEGLFIWPTDNNTLELWYGADLWSKNEKQKPLVDNIEWNGLLPTWYRCWRYKIRNNALWNEFRTDEKLKHLWEPEEKYNQPLEYYDQINDEVGYYRSLTKNDWYVAVSPLTFLGEGLMARHPDGRMIDISLHTPYLTWGCSNATVLPNNQVVCQLGRDQIILLDLESGQIGLIARGRSPVVIFEKESRDYTM